MKPNIWQGGVNMKVLIKGIKINERKRKNNWSVGFDQSNCCCYDDKC